MIERQKRSQYFLLGLFGLLNIVSAQMTSRHVAGPIYMLEGDGANVAVSVGEDGIVIVDDKYKDRADEVKRVLGEIHKGDLQYILNSHHHGDHTGNNAAFGKEVPIIAHENARKRLVASGSPDEAWPIITFNDQLSLFFNGERLRAQHFPASHTDGDLIVVFTGSNVIAMGDLFFSGRFPLIDLDGGGTVAGLIVSIEKLLEHLTEDLWLIPGHGPLSRLPDLNAYRDMLVGTTDYIRGEMAKGLSLEAIQKKGLPEEWARWSWSFIPTERWIKIVYSSYSTAANN